jgi:hypothetical protein
MMTINLLPDDDADGLSAFRWLDSVFELAMWLLTLAWLLGQLPQFGTPNIRWPW